MRSFGQKLTVGVIVGVTSAIVRLTFAPASVAYAASWSEATAKARADERPILLTFGGPWCPSCVRLESQVLSDAQVRNLAKEFICVKVDPRNLRGDDRDALEHKETRYVPEIVLLDPRGEVLGRVEEDFSTPSVAGALTAALEKMKARAY